MPAVSIQAAAFQRASPINHSTTIYQAHSFNPLLLNYYIFPSLNSQISRSNEPRQLFFHPKMVARRRRRTLDSHSQWNKYSPYQHIIPIALAYKTDKQTTCSSPHAVHLRAWVKATERRYSVVPFEHSNNLPCLYTRELLWAKSPTLNKRRIDMSASLDARPEMIVTSTRGMTIAWIQSARRNRRRQPNRAGDIPSIVISMRPTCLRYGWLYVQIIKPWGCYWLCYSSLLVRKWGYLTKDGRHRLSNLASVRLPYLWIYCLIYNCLVPDLTFSEMNFLSRRSRSNPNGLLVEQQGETNGAARREHDSQAQIPQYFSNDYPDEHDVIDETVYPSAQDPDQPEPAAMATEAHGSCTMRPADLSPKLSRSATPYTWYESDRREHERRASSKNCTKGILCVDLNHQHISDEEKANRRYWDLDELKLILVIRQQVRNRSRANKEPEACDHLKRRHQPDEVDDEPRSPKKAKLSNAIASIQKPLSSPASSSTERDTPSHRHPKPGTYTPERQTSRDIDHHELELTPKQVCFSNYCSMSQNCNRAIAPHQNPHPKRNVDSAGSDEIDLDAEFNSIVSICSRETAYGKNEDVIMKDFDAVYDSIVLDDKDPAHGDLSRIPSNQSYFVPIQDGSTPLPDSIDDGWNLSLPSGITNHSSSNNFLAACTHCQPHNINEGVQASNNSKYDTWNGFSQPIMFAVGMGAAAFGTSTGFCWRQNKLYWFI